MEQQLKQRLVGAAVLLGLAVLFIPMVLNNTEQLNAELDEVAIPDRPEGFSSRVVPLTPDLTISDEKPVESIDTENLPLEPIPATDEPVAEPADEDNKPVRVGVTAWAVQLGSFASAENARALEQRLLKQGYAAFVETLTDNQKQVFRVRIGPELLKSSANHMLEQLEKETKLKGIVVRYP